MHFGGHKLYFVEGFPLSPYQKEECSYDFDHTVRVTQVEHGYKEGCLDDRYAARTRVLTYGADMVHTPNIDSLTALSLVFERAYCQVAVCSPSRASLLTGRRPDSNRRVLAQVH